MGRSQLVRSADVRGLVRLLGEAREMGLGGVGDGAAGEVGGWKVRAGHVLEGVGKMIGARVGILGLLAWEVEGVERRVGGGGTLKHAPPVAVLDAVDLGWGDASERAAFLSYAGDDAARDPALEEMMRRAGRFETLPLGALVADREWYRSAHVNELRRAARVDRAIYSFRRAERPGRAWGMGLHRAWGERGFSARDAELVDIMHREGAWVFEPAEERRRERLLRGLTPREREVLGRLVAGDSEKEAARRLGMSRGTVHGHVKAVYLKLGVGSRGELSAFWWGDGGPRTGVRGP